MSESDKMSEEEYQRSWIEAELEEENRGKLIEVIESTLRFLPSEIASEGWMDIWARG